MIDGTMLSTAVMSIAMAAGGFFTGRRTAGTDAMSIASQTVEMLQTQVESLTTDKGHRDLEILDLNNRVAVLEGLVTQRADVAAVKETVDRIAERVGA